MAEEKDGMAKGLLIGFLAGSVVGAVVALLYAPKSGKELRKDIKEKAADIKDEVSERLRFARAKAVDIINDGKRLSDQIVTDAKQQAGHILEDAEKILTTARSRGTTDAYKNEKSKAS